MLPDGDASSRVTCRVKYRELAAVTVVEAKAGISALEGAILVA